VRCGVSKKDQKQYALKIIKFEKLNRWEKHAINREIEVHRSVDHQYIVFYLSRLNTFVHLMRITLKLSF